MGKHVYTGMNKPEAKLKKQLRNPAAQTGEVAKDKSQARRVRFSGGSHSSVGADIATWDETKAPLIKNICSPAKGNIQGPSGAPPREKDGMILLHMVTDARGDGNNSQAMTTLEAFLTTNTRRDKRLQLGLMAISILLGLGGTALMPAS